PAIRAIGASPPKVCPCFCLCLGLSQIIITFPLRLMILHFSQIGFTDALTFIILPPLIRSLSFIYSGTYYVPLLHHMGSISPLLYLLLRCGCNSFEFFCFHVLMLHVSF